MADLVARGEAEFLIYQAEDGRTRIDVRFDGDTAWLSIAQMAELFQRDRSVSSGSGHWTQRGPDTDLEAQIPVRSGLQQHILHLESEPPSAFNVALLQRGAVGLEFIEEVDRTLNLGGPKAATPGCW